MNPKQTLAIKHLEETKVAFYDLLELLEEPDLVRQSVVTKRTIRAVLAHVIMAMETPIPMYVKRARAAKTTPSFFGTKLGHWFSFKLSEQKAKKANLVSLAEDYDVANAKLLKIIEGIRDDEWQLETTMPTRGQNISIEQVFCLQIPRHFEAHSSEIRKSLELP